MHVCYCLDCSRFEQQSRFLNELRLKRKKKYNTLKRWWRRGAEYELNYSLKPEEAGDQHRHNEWHNNWVWGEEERERARKEIIATNQLCNEK